MSSINDKNKMFCFFASPIMIIEFHYVNYFNTISLLFYQSFDLFYGGNVSQGQLIELDPSMAKNLQTILVVFITLLLLFFYQASTPVDESAYIIED